MDCVGVPRDQWMPPIKVLALREQHVGAGGWEPGYGFQALRRELYAIVHLLQPVCVVVATAGLAVEKAAADVGIEGAIGSLFFKFVRQQRPQPSQRLSHSESVISSNDLSRQNGTSPEP